MNNIIDKEELTQIADKGSISLLLDPESFIVSVEFRIRGILFKGQYSPGIKGIYGFSLMESSELIDLYKNLVPLTAQN